MMFCLDFLTSEVFSSSRNLYGTLVCKFIKPQTFRGDLIFWRELEI